MKVRNSSIVGCREMEKTKYGENVSFKTFAKNFLLTSKSCSWSTLYHMEFMER